jgi:hypothetical protein
MIDHYSIDKNKSKLSAAEMDWNDNFYRNFRNLNAMEKVKHLDPKFSKAIERLAKKLKNEAPGNLSRRPRTKTAGRFHRKAKNDDATEHNRDFDFDNDYSVSQDKTEYLIKQSENLGDFFDIESSKNQDNSHFNDNEMDKLTKNHITESLYIPGAKSKFIN